MNKTGPKSLWKGWIYVYWGVRKVIFHILCFAGWMLMSLAGPINIVSAQSPSFSADVYVRKLINGHKVSTSATICYSQNGDFIAHVLGPEDYYMTLDADGQIKVYDPREETIRKIDAPWLQPGSNFLYFFAHRKLSDLGLSSQGFVLSEAKYESPYEITWWTPPANRASLVEKIKLVHQAGKPVFMGYYHTELGLFRKVYFSGDVYVGSAWFPETITTITLRPEEQDSVIQKAVYSNFHDKPKPNISPCNFRIPEHAE